MQTSCELWLQVVATVAVDPSVLISEVSHLVRCPDQ